MGRLLKSAEPTIWALRKNGIKQDGESVPSLYEHLYGYDPIRIAAPESQNKYEGTIRRGSAENPKLNIINPATNFVVRELASDEPSDF